MDMSGHVYIADFGVSASLKKGQKRGTLVGSPCWMAPEVMNQSGHDFAADIWSLGITAIELAEGAAPYQEMTGMKVIMMILNNEPPELPKQRSWSTAFRGFVQSCLQKDPSKRLTVPEIFKQHKAFFDKARDDKYLQEAFLKDLP